MSGWIKFIIDGEPIALARPRLYGKRVYDSQKNQKTKHITTLIAQEGLYLHSENPQDRVKCGLLASSCDFEVELIFCHKWPDNATEAKRNALLWGFRYDHKTESLSPHKSDIDNCIKYVFDVGNGLLWADDRQIISVKAHKVYSKLPRTIIMIKPIPKSYPLSQQILENFSPDDLQALIEAVSTQDWEKISYEEVQVEAAIMISKLAERFAKPLTTIAKKYPKAYEKIVHNPVDSCSHPDNEGS